LAKPKSRRPPRGPLPAPDPLGRPLADIGLRLRVVNLLEKEGLLLVRDVVDLPLEVVSKLETLGKKGFEELKEKLAASGVYVTKWGMRAPRTPRARA
jgi:DNA-directed RNA polymerase alpha subunit